MKETQETPNILNRDLKRGEFYLNNKNLPRAGVEFEWTPDMVREIKKCKQNLLHFAENYFFIVTLDEGKKKIKLYNCQKRILRAFQRYRFNIICSSRQAGKTTVCTIFALWFALFQDDKRIVVVANKEKTAIMILRRIQLAYEQLPNWLKPGIKSWGSTEVLFSNDSSIAIATTSSSAARGESVNCLLIDEMAHIQDHLMEDFWASVIPVISSSRNTKIVAVSTPKGTGNRFYKIFAEAETGKSEWHSEKIGWREIPGRGKKWQKEMLDALGNDQRLFDQEFDNLFVETGDTAVDKNVIEHMKGECHDPVYIFDNGHYLMWEEPIPGHVYAIGCDVGEGIGLAAHVAQVFDFTDLTNIRQVAMYHHRLITTLHFAQRLSHIAEHWGCPPLIIERNNSGGEVINALKETHDYHYIASYNPLKDKDPKKRKDHRIGIHSHTNSKYLGVMNMRYWVNSLEVVHIYDLQTVQELETFVQQPNGTWKHKSGENVWDDRVMALIWTLFILEEPVTVQYFDIIKKDQRGKPLLIKPYNVQQPLMFPLDPFFQQTQNAPLPTFMGADARPFSQDSEVQSLRRQGFRPLRPDFPF